MRVVLPTRSPPEKITSFRVILKVDSVYHNRKGEEETSPDGVFCLLPVVDLFYLLLPFRFDQVEVVVIAQSLEFEYIRWAIDIAQLSHVGSERVLPLLVPLG